MTQLATEQTIWDKNESLPREELQALQAKRLKQAVARVYQNVPFYTANLNALGLTADDINAIDDVRKLPFTVKTDLRDNYPLDLLAVPRDQLARLHASSGTTGKPTFAVFTQEDLDTWSDLCARFLYAGGLRKNQFAHVAFGYGLFTGGFGLHYGIERVGAGVIPAASGNTRRQIALLRDLNTETLICTPSYALNIAEVAREEGLDPATDLPIKFGHFGGEPWTEDMRVAIEAELGITAFNNYGLSEVLGPGVAGECPCRNGMHLQEDHFLFELVDPQTDEPVKPGEIGELIITNLTKQATTLLRYRTRDLCVIHEEPCDCGRTTRRMGRVIGRSDDMMIIRGVNVFPSQIEEALLSVEGTTPHYMIELDRPGNLDQVTVSVEIQPHMFSDKMTEMNMLKRAIDKEIRTITGIGVTLNLVQPQTLARFEGKAKRVIDNRFAPGSMEK
ncbi:Phenylacetate-coenzyme A ligase [Poriferisphaera corsica]|uniref:Phenylacetate-coenzyme A ligase n=1 Tax=Poriferisphaera corsica TaxID=2528020 RepID=A0A517YPD9_9BACT|nr:phenylacetate--CoA ligase [Poriferisphaera corsica]QDU32083.1 Phenylacetate-coenzyme A ligase [Poriferisphaera corsica]